MESGVGLGLCVRDRCIGTILCAILRECRRHLHNALPWLANFFFEVNERGSERLWSDPMGAASPFVGCHELPTRSRWVRISRTGTHHLHSHITPSHGCMHSLSTQHLTRLHEGVRCDDASDSVEALLPLRRSETTDRRKKIPDGDFFHGVFGEFLSQCGLKPNFSPVSRKGRSPHLKAKPQPLAA